ncbi:hypothetical protein [Komagataeibacter xylinus]|uniref:hypothetical protein n=1 Tax=Komagataeibacter xylinus TaxID=28448 RepID=UPI001013D5F2|nr:hypothetical protein [Komagataeibacter xylinus]
MSLQAGLPPEVAGWLRLYLFLAVFLDFLILSQCIGHKQQPVLRVCLMHEISAFAACYAAAYCST